MWSLTCSPTGALASNRISNTLRRSMGSRRKSCPSSSSRCGGFRGQALPRVYSGLGPLWFKMNQAVGFRKPPPDFHLLRLRLHVMGNYEPAPIDFLVDVRDNVV